MIPVHIKTVYGGAGEMARGKVLGEARGPRFRPQHPGKPCTVACEGKAETGGSLGLAEQLVQKNPGSVRQPVSKDKVENNWGRRLMLNYDLYMQTNKHVNT